MDQELLRKIVLEVLKRIIIHATVSDRQNPCSKLSLGLCISFSQEDLKLMFGPEYDMIIDDKLLRFEHLQLEVSCKGDSINPEKLVTEEIVRQAKKQGATLIIGKGVLCTPSARDAIKELKVQVVWN